MKYIWSKDMLDLDVLFFVTDWLKTEMSQLQNIFCGEDLIEQLSATNLGSNFCHPDPFKIHQRVILAGC